jgi:hypothetical protein
MKGSMPEVFRISALSRLRVVPETLAPVAAKALAIAMPE